MGILSFISGILSHLLGILSYLLGILSYVYVLRLRYSMFVIIHIFLKNMKLVTTLLEKMYICCILLGDRTKTI